MNLVANKIKQKSLKDAIKLADQREQDRAKGLFVNDYNSETDSVIDDGEDEESESEQSQNSDHSDSDKVKRQEKNEEDKSEPHDVNIEEEKVELISDKPKITETSVKLKNFSNHSEINIDESESKDDSSFKNKPTGRMNKSTKMNTKRSLKPSRRKIPNTSSL